MRHLDKKSDRLDIVEMAAAIPLLMKLGTGERRVMYVSGSGVQVTATHTGKFSPYDYAVGLVIPGRAEFYPTHVRLLIELHLKRISGAQRDVRRLFRATERVFDGDDPEQLVSNFGRFPMQLDDPDVNLYYAQLLMIEQDFNFGPTGYKRSKLDPPREFLMRFIRWVASGEREIDGIITAAVRNYPAPSRFGRRLTAT